MMKKLLSWILHPWLLAALGLLALALLIWWVGPLVAVAGRVPLADAGVRIALIALLAGGWLAVQLASLWQARRANTRMIEGLAAAPGAGTAAGSGESAELGLLRERFEQALQTLRGMRFDTRADSPGRARGALDALSDRLSQRHLYQLPWYVFIGAPGSGKTTALLNAGLRFPLAGRFGQEGQRGIAGIGGTRHCDWWFTDEAVLIDTAGRYTTQDSDREADRSAWNGFLALLRDGRPRQPLNGVLVTVSVADLLTRGAAERAREAAAVRARIQELHEQLGVRMPLYLLVTKCDLLAGFTDYFATLDREQRAAPWGFTFPLDARLHSDASGLTTEFDRLGQRLTDGLIERLQAERDPARRARIYAFPQQFDALREVLREFVEEVFAPSPFEADPMLRGVYFISGTQEGTPLDRMLGGMARQLGLERAALPPLAASGRSFFLERLLREVVFAESALGGTRLKWEKRRHLMATGAYAALALVALLAAGLWLRSHALNRDDLAAVDARAAALEAELRTTPARQQPDATALLPLLEATRRIAEVDDSPGRHFGLYQGDKLQDASAQALERMQTEGLLPRLALGLEQRLAAGAGAARPEAQYDVLKTYLMLHDPKHFDAKWLAVYLRADWDESLAGRLDATQRAALEHHLDALLARGASTPSRPLDRALVEAARERLRQIPLAQRVYSRLRLPGLLPAELGAFTATAAGGPEVTRILVRGSGRPLNEGLPALYTRAGHQAFDRLVPLLATELAAEESWVLGLAAESRSVAAADPQGQARLADEVRRLYLNDYARLWSDYLADLKLRPTETLAQAIEVAQTLALPGPSAPLRRLLRAAADETTLARPAAPGAESAVREAARGLKDRVLAPILGDGAAGRAVEALQPGREPLEKSLVDDRFVRLHELVGAADAKGPVPLDDTIRLLDEIAVFLQATQAATQSRTPPPPSPTPARARASAGQLPPPLGAMVERLVASGTSAALGATREGLGSAIRAEIGDFCRQAIGGRYPFDRTSSRDVTLDDFSRLFAPGGQMDQFVQKNLAPYVDTTTRPWSFRAVEGARMGLNSAALLSFQHAAEIRDAFFRGSATPVVSVDFRPVSMDPAILQLQIDAGGQTLNYAHGPATLTRLQWPSPRGGAQIRLSISPAPAGGSAGLSTEGPWALLRLIDRAQIAPGSGPERMTATFDIEGRKAVFELISSSVQNPLRLPALRAFSCPTGL